MSREAASAAHRSPWARVLFLALVAVVALTSLPATAQTTESATSVATPDEQKAAEEKPAETQAGEEPAAKVSEEIVVTARRREENIQDVPIAVTMLPAESLQDRGSVDISDIQSEVPNISIYAGRNQSTTLTAFMRGIGQADPLWGVDPGVGLYLDDVYIARPQGALLDVYDVGRIEVLRGPQGTLYGKNTIGGAIKYYSSPVADKPTGQISLVPGSFSNQDIKGVFSTGLAGGRMHIKAAVASLQHDGYGKNLYTGKDVSDKDTTAVRLGLDAVLGQNVSLALNYDYSKDDAQPKGLTRLAANPFCPLFLGKTCPPEQHIFDTRSGLAPLNGTTGEGYAAVLTWKMSPAWQLKSITAYRDSDSLNNIDFDTTPAKIADTSATYFDKQTSEEVQMTYTGGGKLSGVFGAYYFHGKAGGYVDAIFLNGLSHSITEGDVVTDSIAIYGDGSWKFTDQLSLDLGLRATQERKQGRAHNLVNNVVFADFDKSKTWNSLAPKLGLDYFFNPQVMGYVTLSRGFKSGGYNVRAQSTFFPESAEPFDDEILDVGELGVKSTLADGRVVLNAAGFYGKYKDIQVSTFTSYDSNGDGVDDAFFGNFINAGNATMKGIELELALNTDSWFSATGNASWLDATPDGFLDNNHDGFVDTQVITNAPKYTLGVRANGNFPLFGGLLTSSVGYAWRDDSTLTNEGGQYPGKPGTPLLPIVQPAYGLWDAWIAWMSGNSHWRFGVAGKNLTDEQYLTNGYNLPTLGVLQGSYGNPRTYLVTLEYRFF